MADAPPVLATARFVGSRIQPDDLTDFQDFYADPAVMRTLSADGKPWPRHESERLFQRHLDHWEREGFGTWIFREPEGGRFVGRAGLRRVDVTDAPEVEVFYGVASGLWGQGIGTELARRLIDVSFAELQLTRLVGFTLPSNSASRRILEKCGFEHDGEITHAGLRHLFYRLEKHLSD